MKHLFTFLALILFVQFSYAGEFEKELDKFTTVNAHGNYKIFLTKGDKHHIKVENNEPELEDDQISFEVKGGALVIRIKGNLFKKLELKIYVTYEKLLNVEAKGGAWVKCENVLEGDEIELSCGTDGIISAELACETVKASISGGGNGNIRIRGKVEIADLKVSAGGFISAVNMEAKDVTAKISTGGEISCWGTGKMDLKVNTGGTIKYRFDGEDEKSNVTQKTVIAGNIEKIEAKK